MTSDPATGGSVADPLHDVDFFHDPALIADPYPLLARMRASNPVLREPR